MKMLETIMIMVKMKTDNNNDCILTNNNQTSKALHPLGGPGAVFDEETYDI